jgi:hypothetical protein
MTPRNRSVTRSSGETRDARRRRARAFIEGARIDSRKPREFSERFADGRSKPRNVPFRRKARLCANVTANSVESGPNVTTNTLPGRSRPAKTVGGERGWPACGAGSRYPVVRSPCHFSDPVTARQRYPVALPWPRSHWSRWHVTGSHGDARRPAASREATVGRSGTDPGSDTELYLAHEGKRNKAVSMNFSTTEPCRRCGGIGTEVSQSVVREVVRQKVKQHGREAVREALGGISDGYLKSLLNGNRDFTGKMLRALFGDGSSGELP